MKILFVATVRSHIGQFHMPFIRELKSRGCEVHAAFRDNSEDKKNLDLSGIDKVFEVPFDRNPYSKSNIKAFFALRKIIKENHYDAIHCHTPVGGFLTRLAAIPARWHGTQVIYTAHGFHFYEGSSKFSWKVYYPIELLLSRVTDCLIAINLEDFKLAFSKKFKSHRTFRVNGVGVDLSKFHSITDEEKSRLRKENGFSDDDYLLIFPADLCKRKNQYMLFDVMKILLEKNDDFKLLLPGLAADPEPFIEYAKQAGVYDHISILGYRRDMHELIAMCDMAVSSSRQEGLPINIIEAMSIGLPVVATEVRGNRDLVFNKKNGFVVKLNDAQDMADKILEIRNSPELTEHCSSESQRISHYYEIEKVIEKMVKIYQYMGLLEW